MIEIQPSELKVNQIYYVDMSHIDVPSGHLISIGFPSKLKVKYIGKFPANSDNPEFIKFYIYIGVNSTKIDYRLGSCAYVNYRNYKYYLPTKDALIQKKERDTVNAVLQNITGDPWFKYI